MQFDEKQAQAKKLICPQCGQELHECSCRQSAPVAELVETLDTTRIAEKSPGTADSKVENPAGQIGQSSTTASKDPNLGRIIGERYTLMAVLGTGGMGTVYRAKHVTLGKPLALKMLRIEQANLDELKIRFEREAAGRKQTAAPTIGLRA